jgi:hypothetical protein
MRIVSMQLPNQENLHSSHHHYLKQSIALNLLVC